MKPGDWMKYADFTYNGTKYRAVTFSQYRPYWTDNSTSSGTNQDYNGYTTNNIYYFKYEPLKWRVLDPSTGLVLCESIIDSQAYSNTIYSYGTDEMVQLTGTTQSIPTMPTTMPQAASERGSTMISITPRFPPRRRRAF